MYSRQGINPLLQVCKKDKTPKKIQPTHQARCEGKEHDTTNSSDTEGPTKFHRSLSAIEQSLLCAKKMPRVPPGLLWFRVQM